MGPKNDWITSWMLNIEWWSLAFFEMSGCWLLGLNLMAMNVDIEVEALVQTLWALWSLTWSEQNCLQFDFGLIVMSRRQRHWDHVNCSKNMISTQNLTWPFLVTFLCSPSQAIVGIVDHWTFCLLQPMSCVFNLKNNMFSVLVGLRHCPFGERGGRGGTRLWNWAILLEVLSDGKEMRSTWWYGMTHESAMWSFWGFRIVHDHALV